MNKARNEWLYAWQQARINRRNGWKTTPECRLIRAIFDRPSKSDIRTARKTLHRRGF